MMPPVPVPVSVPVPAPVARSTKINLQEIKNKFLRILGPIRETEYTRLLSNFLSFKLTKAELDKLVPSTIGKENVVLHNQFVRAIFSNATCSDASAQPPAAHDTSKPVKGIRRKPLVGPSGAGGGVFSDDVGPVSPVPSTRANGDGVAMPPSSPRKGRSTTRDRKPKERPSPLGFHHRGEASTSQGGSLPEEEGRGVLENGPFKCDVSRPVQPSPYPAAEHSNLELPSPVFPASKRQRLYPAIGGDDSTTAGGANALDDEEIYEEEEEMEEHEDEVDLGLSTRLVKPPFGIPFCIASLGAPRRVPLMSVVGPLTHTLLGDSLHDEETLEGIDLPDGEGLQRRMHQIAVTENGLDGVSIEAANLLNLALDEYLKRLIVPAMELARLRRSPRKQSSAPMENGGFYQGNEVRQDSCNILNLKQVNGIWPAHISPKVDSAVGEAAAPHEGNEKSTLQAISPLDFKIAMELNPKLLGEEWPTLMEKIALRVSDL